MVLGSLVKWLGLGLVGAFVVLSMYQPGRASAAASALKEGGSILGSYGTGIQTLLTGIGTGAAKLFNPLFTLRDLIFGPQAGAQVQKDIWQSATTQNLTNAQSAGALAQIQLDPNAPYTPVTTGFGGVPLGTPPDYSFQLAEQGAAAAANTALEQGSYTGGFSYQTLPGFGGVPVASVIVHGQNLPLSQAAIQYYQEAGVTVAPAPSQTVASQNSGNATSAASASANPTGHSGGPLGAAQAAGYSTGAATGSNGNGNGE